MTTNHTNTKKEGQNMNYKNNKKEAKSPTRKSLRAFILIILQTVLRANQPALFKYGISFPSESQSYHCPSPNIVFYVMRVKHDSAKPVSINLKTAAILDSDKYVTDTTGRKRYGVYDLGSNCFYHKDRTGMNSNPVFILVLEHSNGPNPWAAGEIGCRVTRVITNNDLQACHTSTNKMTEDIFDVIQLGLESGTAASTNNFQKIERNEDYYFKQMSPIAFNFTDLDFSNFDSRIMELLLAQGLTSQSPRVANLASVLNYDVLKALNSRVQFNTFAMAVNGGEIAKRLNQDDLPGYYLGVYSGAADKPSKYIQQVFSPFEEVSNSMNLNAYISKPSSLGIGEEHSLEFSTKAYRYDGSQENYSLKELKYQISVIRNVEFLIQFKVKRFGVEIMSRNHYFSGADKFIYFSLTVGAGLLYFTAPTLARVKYYESFHIFEVGLMPQRLLTVYEETAHLSTAIIYDSSQEHKPKQVWMKVEYKPPVGITENKAGFRVLSLAPFKGAYPPYLITDRGTRFNYPRCYFETDKVNYCIAMALLADVSETQVISYVTGSWSRAVRLTSHQLKETCRVGYYSKNCLLPKTGFIIDIQKVLSSPVGGFGGLSLDEFNQLDPDLKRFVHVFENNLGRKLMVSCPYSCKSKHFLLFRWNLWR